MKFTQIVPYTTTKHDTNEIHNFWFWNDYLYRSQEFGLDFTLQVGECLLGSCIVTLHISLMWQKEKGWPMHCPLELQGVPDDAPIHQASHSMMPTCSLL